MVITRPRIVSVAAIACLLASLSCVDLTAATPTGKLSAQVVDPNNVGVQAVAADLYKYVEGGALLWRASLTSSNGIAVFGASDGGVAVGDYYIHVRFTNNYALAPGETNDKQVTVTNGDDIVVTFHAIAMGPGGA